ncbi:hypothetical protein GCM10027047_27180 [Rhodococcus aerolatus]
MARTDPDDLGELIRRGRAHRGAGDLDAAVAVFTAAHHAHPAQPRPLVERGAILILQGGYDAARADYDSAAQLDPGYPGLASYVAELDLYTGRAQQALELSTTATVAEPDNLMHPINVAHAHLLLGHRDEALAGYRAVAHRVHQGKGLSGAEVAAHDLHLLTRAGVDVPGLAEVRALLRG